MSNLIPIVIEPYPDELLYSWIIRLAKANELSNRIFLETYLEKSDAKKHHIEIDIRKGYKSFYNALNSDIDMMDLYFQMSTTQFEISFTSTRQQIKALNNIFRKESSFVNIDNYYIREPKVCLECIKEDITKYSEPYIHRSHQLSGVAACHKHHTPLYNLKKRYKSLHDYDFENISDKVCDITDSDCQYAEYAFQLLKNGLSSTANDILLVISDKLNELLKEGNLPKEQTTDNIIKSLLKYNKNLFTQETINVLLWLFPDVNDFLNKLPHYDMVIKKHCNVCNRDYYTTNQAIQDGWGCTYCDDEMDETKLLKRLVKKIGDDEFIFKSVLYGQPKRLILYRKLTDKEVAVKLSSFLFENTKYHCTKMMTRKEVEQKMKQFKHFKLISYAGVSNPVKIYHDVCGNTFDLTSLHLFINNPICRCCESKQGFNFDVFKQQVKDIVGDEYEVLEHLESASDGTNKVKIRHNKCGKTKEYRSYKFLTGERCPYCTPLITENCMEKMIKEYSNERYEIISRNKRKVILLDTKTNEQITLSPRHIVQEIERPTPSPILEFKNKKIKQITAWDIWYELCIEYKNEFGHLYPRGRASYKGKFLGSWCEDQRKLYKQGKLSEEQIHKLQALDFVFDTAFYNWNQRLKEYKKYIEETGILFPKKNTIYNGNNLGSWVRTQRLQKKKGKLSPVCEKLLLEINPDFFNTIK